MQKLVIFIAALIIICSGAVKAQDLETETPSTGKIQFSENFINLERVINGIPTNSIPVEKVSRTVGKNKVTMEYKTPYGYFMVMVRKGTKIVYSVEVPKISFVDVALKG